MKMMDPVELIVENERYAKEGVHKGMQGWICLEESVNGTWLVNFPGWYNHADIATIAIKEEDLKVIPRMDARVTERIKAEFEGT